MALFGGSMISRSIPIASMVGIFIGLASVEPLAIVAPFLRPADVQRAQVVARSSEAARARFHAAYVFPVQASQIQQVEVISEFRRAVILTEEHLRRGDWLFAQGGRNLDGHNLEDALKQWTGRLVIAARLQFGPLHAYATVPDVRIALEGSPAVVAINLRSIPRSSFPAGTAGTRPDGRRYRKRFRSLRRRTRRAPDQRVRQRHAQRARDSRFSVAWTSRSCTIRRSPCRTR